MSEFRIAGKKPSRVSQMKPFPLRRVVPSGIPNNIDFPSVF